MKVIDLLNKIANGEEIPKKIKFDYHYYIYDENYNTYYQEMSGGNQLRITINELNDEIEIIEEKKIPKKLKCKYTSQIGKIELAKTINEIIDYLESKGDE